MRILKTKIITQIILIVVFAHSNVPAAMWTHKSSVDLPESLNSIWEFTGNPTKSQSWAVNSPPGSDWRYFMWMSYDNTSLEYTFDIDSFKHITNPHTDETKGGSWGPAAFSFAAVQNLSSQKFSGGPFTHEPGPHYDMFSYSIMMVNADTDNEKITVTLDAHHIPVPGALLLGSIGLGFAGWKLRKRKELLRSDY